MPKTRGRAACNTCRTRKQKCDGIGPECSRCRRFNHHCTWPKSLKRGPAKGYTKALECRLQETELALLQLLLSSQDETITKAFHPGSQSIACDYHEQLYHQLAEHDSPGGSEQKQRALRDQWEQFPLQTASDMRHWTKRLVQGANNQPQNDIQELSTRQHSFGDFFNNTDNQPLTTFQSLPSVVEEPTIESQNPRTLIGSIPSAGDMQATGEADKNHEVRHSAFVGIELPTNFKDSFLW